MSRRTLRPPWFFCTGWWSPWCVLDVIACHIGRYPDWLAKRHHAAYGRHLERHHLTRRLERDSAQQDHFDRTFDPTDIDEE